MNTNTLMAVALPSDLSGSEVPTAQVAAGIRRQQTVEAVLALPDVRTAAMEAMPVAQTPTTANVTPPPPADNHYIVPAVDVTIPPASTANIGDIAVSQTQATVNGTPHVVVTPVASASTPNMDHMSTANATPPPPADSNSIVPTVDVTIPPASTVNIAGFLVTQPQPTANATLHAEAVNHSTVPTVDVTIAPASTANVGDIPVAQTQILL